MAFGRADNLGQRFGGASMAGAVDERAFLSRVFLWMTAGLGLTGLVAAFVVSTPSLLLTLVHTPFLYFGLMIAELVVVIAFSAMAGRLGAFAAAAMFVTYAVLNGITFSTLALVYTGTSIASAFFITAGTFGAMSVFGAVTRKDLSGWGSFLFMGLIGMLIAMVVNIFVGSSLLGWVVSCMGVLVFTGLTPYDVQKIRRLAYADSLGERSPLAIHGALVLYLDFINLFLSLLRLLNSNRR